MSAAVVKAVLTQEFLAYQGNVLFNKEPANNDWYIALFKGTTAPTDSLTAANIWDTYTEVTEYDGDRPKWLPTQSVNGVFGIPAPENPKDPVPAGVVELVFNSVVTINGAALISKPPKGGKDGLLVAAWVYPEPFVKNTAETFAAYFTITLTNSAVRLMI